MLSWEITVFLIYGLGKLDNRMQKKEIGLLSYNTHKNWLEMTKGLNIRTEI